MLGFHFRFPLLLLIPCPLGAGGDEHPHARMPVVVYRKGAEAIAALRARTARKEERAA